MKSFKCLNSKLIDKHNFGWVVIIIVFGMRFFIFVFLVLLLWTEKNIIFQWIIHFITTVISHFYSLLWKLNYLLLMKLASSDHDVFGVKSIDVLKSNKQIPFQLNNPGAWISFENDYSHLHVKGFLIGTQLN